MGPIRSISGMVSDVREQIAEIGGITERMRMASRRLTGGTGMAPVPISPPQAEPNSIKGEPPLLAQLTIAIADLGGALTDLRNEVTYIEAFTETGEPRAKMTAYEANVGGVAKGW